MRESAASLIADLQCPGESLIMAFIVSSFLVFLLCLFVCLFLFFLLPWY